jgi:N-methylhydantoinase A/oxoprolinase/acetone carboxylase beta subunit
VLLAHSTTQATNALLEGDIARVGIVLLGSGFEGRLARRSLERDHIELAPGKFLQREIVYLDVSQEANDDTYRRAIHTLQARGSEVLVATEVFGVDHPEREERVAQLAGESGILATTGTSISQLYGLRVRTRTAVINASMMPRMLETANLTEQAVKESGIDAPLMIMRSDGGIMDIAEMRRRPILTMLSGPAAGVAAAIMYAHISDGIFLEVGGTSTDISVIRNGRPQIKSAQIGGNRLFLSTLDVRTLGIAGGSMPRVSEDGRILDVGPRSAHIADLAYPAFADPEDLEDVEIQRFAPRQDDPDDYLKLKVKGDRALTLTPTEASNFLGLVTVKGHGAANQSSIAKIFSFLEQKWQKPAVEIAEAVLTRAAEKLQPVIRQLTREYKLEEHSLRFIGGGGGATALVPFTARYLNLPSEIVENTEVISAIGAALGMIRDSVERSVANPSDADLVSIRQAAAESVQRMGADPESIEVTVEIDSRNKRVRAVATGTSELRIRRGAVTSLDDAALLEKARQSLGDGYSQVELKASSSILKAYEGSRQRSFLFGLVQRKETAQRILDPEGVVRLQLRNAVVQATDPQGLRGVLNELIETFTTFGDAGALLPDLMILAGARILDLSGLVEQSQVQALLDVELKDIAEDEPLVVLVKPKR